MPLGSVPTLMVATTLFELSEITETELLAVFDTNISPLAESYAMSAGESPTLIVATT